jgi:copper chaperone
MLEFQVEDMSCGGGANSAKSSLQAVDGNANVEVDLVNNKVRVDSSADMSAIVAAIVEAGYPVTASVTV